MWSAKQYRTKAAPIDAFLYSKSKIALVGAVRNLCMTNTEAQKSYYGTTYFETVFLTRSVKAMSNAILSLKTEEGSRLLRNIFDNGVPSQFIPFHKKCVKSVEIYIDLQNPLLRKYGFDPEAFIEGATSGINEVRAAFASRDFTEHCRGGMVKSSSSTLLRETLHPGLYLPYFFLTKSFLSHPFSDFRVRSVHFNSIDTKIQSIESMVEQKRYNEKCMNFHPSVTYSGYLEDSKRTMEREAYLLKIANLLRMSGSEKFINHFAKRYLLSTRKKRMEKDDINRYLKYVFERFRVKAGYSGNSTGMSNEILYYDLMEAHYLEVMRIQIISLEKEKDEMPLSIFDFYDLNEEKKKFDSRRSKENSSLTNSKSNADEKLQYNCGREKDDVVYPYFLPYSVGSVIASVDLTVVCDRGEGTESSFFGWKFQGCISEHSDLNWMLTSMYR